MRTPVFLLFAALLVAGCTTLTPSDVATLSDDELIQKASAFRDTPWIQMETGAELFKEAERRGLIRPDYSGAAYMGNLKLGMNRNEAYIAMGGLPSKTNRTVGQWGVHEQLVYLSGAYVYLENGKVTGWQD